jgi:hypothetical protein
MAASTPDATAAEFSKGDVYVGVHPCGFWIWGGGDLHATSGVGYDGVWPYSFRYPPHGYGGAATGAHPVAGGEELLPRQFL